MAQFGFDLVAGYIGGHQQDHGDPHQQNGGVLHAARRSPQHHRLQPCLAVALHQQVKPEQGNRCINGLEAQRTPAGHAVFSYLRSQALQRVNAQKERQADQQLQHVKAFEWV